MLHDYPVTLTLPVLWSDQDAFGHVNNTVCIRWFESARVAYLERLGRGSLISEDHLGPILAQVTCNYRRQLRYPDNVTIGSRVTKIGNSSMVMAHAIWSEQQQAIAADGDSVVVMFHYELQKPQRVPDDLRAAIEQLERRA
ncbi:MAG TPA: thioesterase family protein [Pirellulaceae bacterium]|nr:thioesterase family protein [Pirellulaceae bacterium]